ncbi:hypothetical protein ACHHYP_20381 [Achlya hypogyna]|uniref:DDE-1 domain-containing protein n=1 Tax=Achlya hypogyna TaxID=1202772 RepID=A0A1V9ZKE7_ACHHY|nr:hypothetical protein ACHHYP_20381 [Achlya hypogyna]
MCSEFVLSGYGANASPAGVYCSEACAFGETDAYLDTCVHDRLDTTPVLKRREYKDTMRERKILLTLFFSGTYSSAHAFSVLVNVPSVTFHDWIRRNNTIFAWDGPERAATFSSQGHRENNPFFLGLVTFMKDMRRNNVVVTTHDMLEYVSFPHPDWYDVYMTCKISPERAYNTLLNQKSSDRTTAVLTICANGDKLPVLFIVHGKPDGTIEKDELLTNPQEHLYVVQENAWMDQRVWQDYLQRLRRFHLRSKSLLLLDKFDAYVIKESYSYVTTALDSTVYPLPLNASSVCQPLDVGVMGPLKAKLCTEWLKERSSRHGLHLTARVKRSIVIHRVARVWRAFKSETIVGAFEKALPNFT